MNLERVVFGFFIILALALNLGFVAGAVDNPGHHDPWLLFAALIISLITSGLKLGDRSQLGALVLAASLVANSSGSSLRPSTSIRVVPSTVATRPRR